MELPWGERSGPVRWSRIGQSVDLPAIARCGPRSSRLAPWWLRKAAEPAAPATTRSHWWCRTIPSPGPVFAPLWARAGDDARSRWRRHGGSRAAAPGRRRRAVRGTSDLRIRLLAVPGGRDHRRAKRALDVSEVFRLADAVPARFRVLILLAAFTGLRFGELAALQRHDLDLERRTVAVRRALAETRTDGIVVKTPKSAAGVRTVAFPASLTAELTTHLAAYAEPGRNALVFTGERGGQLRRNNFRRLWLRALKTTGLRDVHFHDLRHTGNTLAATGGATTRELMQRMGHSSVRAALIYQHLVNGRDHAIAAHVDEQIRRVRPAESDEPSGT
ncbi:tyrosine-type recombinase/integrase [Streptomyces sp. NPDC047980]|uniref:tyrosine-type recombinase/integrase n=1 Tax=Streptomyces sp. NPDC047980 TaxID=3365494 RepID=UPI00371494AC